MKDNFGRLKARLTDIAYKSSKNLKAYISGLDNNWELLAKTHDDEAAQKNDLKAVAFINKTTKEVVIAHAGTDPRSASDLIDDLLIGTQEIPAKLNNLKSFAEQIIVAMGGEEVAKTYKFSTTGHSLGGVLSDLTAVELLSRGLDVAGSETFDSPGSKPIIEKAISRKLFTGQEATMAKVLQMENISYTAKPNAINTTNEHLGKIYIVMPKISSDASVAQETAQESVGNSYVSYLFNKVGSAVSKAASFLSLDTVAKCYDSISKLHNPEYLAAMSKEMKIINDGVLEIYNSNLKRFDEIKKDFVKVAQDVAIVSGGIGLCLSGNIIQGGLTAMKGAYGVYKDGSKLYSDVVSAYDDAVKLAHRINNVTGHSLFNFTEIDSTNTFEVIEGYGSKHKGLVVKLQDKGAVELLSNAQQADYDAKKAAKSAGLNSWWDKFKSMYTNYNEQFQKITFIAEDGVSFAMKISEAQQLFSAPLSGEIDNNNNNDWLEV